jgi:hypothetical protein
VLNKDPWNANGHCHLPGPSGPSTACAHLPGGLQAGLSDKVARAWNLDVPLQRNALHAFALGPVMQVSLA